jgi:hypothetical protein
MADNDDFDTVVDELNSESVTIEREMKTFPLCPKGMHKGKCIKAELKETEFEGRKEMKLSLTWELEAQFDDERDGETVKKNYRVFDTLGLYFGPKARLHKVFKELTGEDVKALVKEQKIKKDGRDFIRSTFSYPAFMEMKADILIRHQEGKSDPSKVYANIDTYSCDEATQKANAALVFEDGTGK